MDSPPPPPAVGLKTVTLAVPAVVPEHRSETVETVGLYWHFVDVVWIVIFAVVYLIP